MNSESSISSTINWLGKFICLPLFSLCNMPAETEISFTTTPMQLESGEKPELQQMDRVVDKNPVPLHEFALQTRQELSVER